MRILLVQNASYIPIHGGAEKSNRMLVEGLAARGHDCRVVARVYLENTSSARLWFLDHLAAQGAQVLETLRGVVAFQHKGVKVYAATDGACLRKCLLQQIREFAPTRTLVPSGDPGQVLLEAALKTSPAPVTYMARGTSDLPFGPDSFLASRVRTALLRQTADILAVSHFLAEYIRRWSGLDAKVLPISLFGSGPFPRFGCFDEGWVTMINPCAYKGISIFLALARSLPDVQFAAVPMWGTTSADRTALEELSNVTLLEPTEDIDEIFSHTRVLLMPSLWAEAGARTVVEAMLRGIPVLASDVGGIPEAKLGVDYLLPVSPIERYKEGLDDRMFPIPVVPDQDVGPWLEALGELLSDRGRYDRLSEISRKAAQAFVTERGGVERIERFLESLSLSSRVGYSDAFVEQASRQWEKKEPRELGANLTAKKRALLALRLKERRGQDSQ